MSDEVYVALDEDVIRAIEYIRTNNVEAETVSQNSFVIYASGIDRDGDRYTTEWMKGNSVSAKDYDGLGLDLIGSSWLTLLGVSTTSATVWDLLDRIRDASATDKTMLDHIQTVQEVAEENRNYKVWTEDGLFDAERAYGFSCPTVEQNGELSDSSEDEEDTVVVVA